ncbi:hypothetical protein CH341_13565 [Rhodoplanes roseus]|uniref:General secretion pathway protein GspJ n=1 Tax=Rhodoplanes roseus TaxID=29409 RepID=A0A327KZI1_9BRAD|nr:hypothetical protein CH341_13565 [Rhodoplanes roseus]
MAGFTLVEALVALALMGLVLTALATVTSQWLPNWNRGLGQVQRSELVALAIDRIVADLAAAEFVPANRETKKPLFEGSELGVTFVRTAIGPNARPGLETVRLAESSYRRGLALARSTAPFVPRDAQAGPLGFSDPVVLLSAPYRASFSFADRDGGWRGEWIDAEELPRAIRLVVRDTATGRTLGASTATVVHAQLPAECVIEKTRRGCDRERLDGTSGEAPAAPTEPSR